MMAKNTAGVRAQGAGLVDGVQGKETHFDINIGSLAATDVSCTVTGTVAYCPLVWHLSHTEFVERPTHTVIAYFFIINHTSNYKPL